MNARHTLCLLWLEGSRPPEIVGTLADAATRETLVDLGILGQCLVVGVKQEFSHDHRAFQFIAHCTPPAGA